MMQYYECKKSQTKNRCKKSFHPTKYVTACNQAYHTSLKILHSKLVINRERTIWERRKDISMTMFICSTPNSRDIKLIHLLNEIVFVCDSFCACLFLFMLLSVTHLIWFLIDVFVATKNIFTSFNKQVLTLFINNYIVSKNKTIYK